MQRDVHSRLPSSLILTAAVVILAFNWLATAYSQESTAPLRVGMIGLDTSHVISFTRLINNPKAKGNLAKISVVAAFPGGSPDFPPSRDRVEGFTKQIAEMDIAIVDSIPALLKQVDAVMLESVDGSQHLEQVRPVFKAGKRVFIDKPFTASLVDALMIVELSKRSGVPFFSCSSKRYQAEYKSTLAAAAIGNVYGCDVYGTSKSVPNHPDLFWYGVHGCEVLSTVMGPGLESVTAYQTPSAEHVRGTWSNGRIGTFRGLREDGGKAGFGLTVFGKKKIIQSGIGSDKLPLLDKMAHFFLTGETPLPPSATIEVFALMQAAEASKAGGGKSINIAEFIRDARKEAITRLANP